MIENSGIRSYFSLLFKTILYTQRIIMIAICSILWFDIVLQLIYRSHLPSRETFPSKSQPWPYAATGYAGSPCAGISIPLTSVSGSILKISKYHNALKMIALRNSVQRRMMKTPKIVQPNWYQGENIQSPSLQPYSSPCVLLLNRSKSQPKNWTEIFVLRSSAYKMSSENV